MSAPLLIWILLAIAMCWSVGLYQRITRLRGRVQHFSAIVERLLAAHQALPELPPGVASLALLRRRLDSDARVEAARANCQQVVNAYNQALRAFPARLIVWLMGFRPATTP